mmetsp:Transcript_24990/g.54895  ORF Transcript_24990/g.54895 Transcript_24990/m.54895 type:complete len:377 (-) Transcript_24990:186-1316(-)|eukprot:CAMPEP_0201123342 /NCGR_PEP_ID=MMETSP0850-20130426/6732_1 /ASSEMBLY_ACC=CAM_ASM_000622 /TAXON_ID=183588 /ORGANISM="Pseudo-nitzschia fraudulenta, Strain WWA7" /LENGTH=376 /DNA_ID=CAMNT_0047390225 /DNA_START=145 /DNA_END=1275 /DNA_ORIENTATION=+
MSSPVTMRSDESYEYFNNIISPSSFSFKRAATESTKASNSTHDSQANSYDDHPSYNQDGAESNSTENDTSTHDGSQTFGSTQDYSQTDASTISNDNSSLTTRHSLGVMENENNMKIVTNTSQVSMAEETMISLPFIPEDDSSEFGDEEFDDQIIETKTKNRSLSLLWDRGNTFSSYRTANEKSITGDDECQPPDGICKSDITVTIDIDDEARSSRVEDLDEENLDVEILHHRRRDSGDSSPLKRCHRQRRKFEETVRQGLLDDLTSVYTATPQTAKYVLCVVVSVLSDGTLDHTFWSGGRVGLAEIVLQWVLFDADDLQVYKRGRVVQKKDFGFGPLGLTENEGQHFLSTSLAPKASNQIMRTIGNGVCEELFAEF